MSGDPGRPAMDLTERLAKLTPAQRALLEAKLKERGIAAPPRVHAITPIPGREALEHFPASFDQERLWFIDQMEPGNPAYNIHTTTRLKGPLDLDRMRRAVNAVIARHEVLRTTFRVVDGRPVQVVAPSLEIDLPLVDLTDRPETEREAAAQAVAVEATQIRFDLANGPLIAVTMARLGPEDHVMMVLMHHIITDRWSFDVFEREVGRWYVALRDGTTPELPPLPIQFADFAAWQREELDGERGRRHVEYWKERLRGAPMVLEIAPDRPRPPVQTFRGKREYITYPVPLMHALKALTKECGATMFMTFLAGLDILCWKYARMRDLVIGSTIVDRNRTETENVIGYFLNMLLLRARIDPAMSFRDLLAQVKETALSAYAHQDVPFATLVAELKPRQDVSRNPLMQISLIYLDFELLRTPEELGLASSSLDVDNLASRVDMTLACWELPDAGIHSYIEYNTDIYDGSKVQAMLVHLGRILEQAVAAPDRPLADVALLTEEETARLVTGFQPAPGDGGGLLHDGIAEAARDHPTGAAIVQGDRVTTYRALDDAADRIARALATRRLGPGDVVPVRATRSAAQIEALLGVLRAGAAYAPLDPALPADRAAAMLADLHPRAIVTAGGPASAASGGAPALDVADLRHADVPAGIAPPVPAPEDLAYVMFTSGSTGVPKGVMVPHRAIANQMRWSQETFPLRADDRVLHNAAFGFDVSVWEIFAALRAGATLVLPREEDEKDPAALVRLMREQRVTVAACVPSLLRAWLDDPDFPRDDSLRLLFVGGESMDSELVDRLREARPECRLVHLYGPTEAAVTSLFQPCGRDRPEGRIPLGRPVSGLRVYVLDDTLHPAPPGVPGEICLGGVGLAHGYLARPDLTAERFIPDPFSDTPGARLYRTGDLAKHRADGTLEFTGRADHQVKIRGYRIEPGEVEAALTAIPGIARAVAVARTEELDPRLVAYWEPDESGGPPEGTDLRTALRRTLPEFMIPSAFVRMDALPLGENGKVDRLALPAPDRAALSTAPWIAPRTPVEEAIAATWQEVLRTEGVGAMDDFFELGGDSLLATQVVARLKAAFAIDLPLRRFFQGSTVEALAAAVEERLLEKLESMTEEEAARALASARGERSSG